LTYLALPQEHGAFVGDSTDALEAGHTAGGLPVVGHANKPGKDRRLRDAGADAIITSMGDLLQTLRPRALGPRAVLGPMPRGISLLIQGCCPFRQG